MARVGSRSNLREDSGMESRLRKLEQRQERLL